MTVQLNSFLFKSGKAPNHNLSNDTHLVSAQVNSRGLEMYIHVYENCLLEHSICRDQRIQDEHIHAIYDVKGYDFLRWFSDDFEEILRMNPDCEADLAAELI